MKSIGFALLLPLLFLCLPAVHALVSCPSGSRTFFVILTTPGAGLSALVERMKQDSSIYVSDNQPLSDVPKLKQYNAQDALDRLRAAFVEGAATDLCSVGVAVYVHQLPPREERLVISALLAEDVRIIHLYRKNMVDQTHAWMFAHSVSAQWSAAAPGDYDVDVFLATLLTFVRETSLAHYWLSDAEREHSQSAGHVDVAWEELVGDLFQSLHRLVAFVGGEKPLTSGAYHTFLDDPYNVQLEFIRNWPSVAYQVSRFMRTFSAQSRYLTLANGSPLSTDGDLDSHRLNTKLGLISTINSQLASEKTSGTALPGGFDDETTRAMKVAALGQVVNAPALPVAPPQSSSFSSSKPSFYTVAAGDVAATTTTTTTKTTTTAKTTTTVDTLHEKFKPTTTASTATSTVAVTGTLHVEHVVAAAEQVHASLKANTSLLKSNGKKATISTVGTGANVTHEQKLTNLVNQLNSIVETAKTNANKEEHEKKKKGKHNVDSSNTISHGKDKPHHVTMDGGDAHKKKQHHSRSVNIV